MEVAIQTLHDRTGRHDRTAHNPIDHFGPELLPQGIMKRKGSILEDERDPKRLKLEEGAEDLSSDAVREILKHVDDRALIYLSRVSKVWNRASRIERGRFIEQKLNRLKWMSKHSSSDPKALLGIVGNEIGVIKTELEKLTQFQADLLAKNANSLSTIARFKLWRDSSIEKEDHSYRIDIAPAGEVDLWEMSPFANDDGYRKGRTYDLDSVLEIIEEHLDVQIGELESEDFIRGKKILLSEEEIQTNADVEDEDEDDEDSPDLEQCEKLMSLEKYLEELMKLNFGSCVNDW